jgi:hypothetical protein
MSGGIPPTVKSGIYSRVKSGVYSHALFLVALTSVVALSLALPSTSSAQATVTKTEMEMLFPGNNPCTGEAFLGTSRMTLIEYPRRDGSGGTHTTFRLVTHTRATTLAADPPRKYQGYDEESVSLNMPSSGTTESTLLVHQVLVRQGEEQSSLTPLANDDDFRFMMTFHITMSSNGITTARVTNVHGTECAGPPLGPAAITVP